MKIILQKSVDKLGNPGDIAEVADGYARNYLIPRGLAIKAEKGAVRHAESLKRAHVNQLSKQKGEYEALASKLIAGGPLMIPARAGEEGKLFGSVTAADIAEAIEARIEHTVDRHDVQLDEPIRSVGTHEVKVKLFHEVEPILTVEVVAAGVDASGAGAVRRAPGRPRSVSCQWRSPHLSTWLSTWWKSAGQGRSDNKLRRSTCGAAIHTRSPLSAAGCDA